MDVRRTIATRVRALFVVTVAVTVALVLVSHGAHAQGSSERSGRNDHEGPTGGLKKRRNQCTALGLTVRAGPR